MIAKIVVTALLAAMLGFAGSIKVIGVAQSLTIRDHLGVKPVQWRMIGALELAAVAGVLIGLSWPPIGVAAAIGSALLLLGAIGFHVRSSDSAADTAPAVDRCGPGRRDRHPAVRVNQRSVTAADGESRLFRTDFVLVLLRHVGHGVDLRLRQAFTHFAGARCGIQCGLRLALKMRHDFGGEQFG